MYRIRFITLLCALLYVLEWAISPEEQRFQGRSLRSFRDIFVKLVSLITDYKQLLTQGNLYIQEYACESEDSSVRTINQQVTNP